MRTLGEVLVLEVPVKTLVVVLFAGLLKCFVFLPENWPCLIPPEQYFSIQVKKNTHTITSVKEVNSFDVRSKI